LTVQRLLEEGEIVVPTFQTSGLAGLQGNENSRLLGTTGRRGQPISTAALLKTASNPAPEQTRDQQPIAAANTARVVVERHI
jgi:Golgi nucleoside diphosphatase